MEELKSFNIRLPKNIWKFLKKSAAEQEVSMLSIITECLERYKKNQEKKLTNNDAKV